MSLQAKIEAVIYASEEPVTLPQLVGLLRGEAEAELDASESRQATLTLDTSSPYDESRSPESQEAPGEAPGDEDALNAELLNNPELSEPAGDDSSTSPADKPLELAKVPSEPAQKQPSDTTRPDGADQAAATHPLSAEAEKSEAARAKARERRLREHFRSVLDRLIADYAGSGHGLEIREVAGGFRMATKPEYHDTVRGFVRSLKPPLKLSLQALETLAVVAYKQPITAPEIGEIRGVDSGGVLGSLLTRKLITTAGRKPVIGRPILYKTTKEFLLRFGLKDINELPSIEEFEKMAGEFNEAVQEEIPMASEPASQQSGSAGSAPLNELNATPEETYALHDTPEDMMSDRSSQAEGAATEPSSGVSADAARAVEQSAAIHRPQADGNSTPTQVEETDNSGDDAIVDGRISGIPPNEAAAEADNPSAQEAAEQSAGGGGA